MFEAAPESMRPVFAAALAAVDPERAVRHALAVEAGMLRVGGQSVPLPEDGRVILLAAGKAAAPMVRGAEDALEGYTLRGLAVTRYGHQTPTRHVRIVEAGHPVPDTAGLEAGKAILALAESARAGDLVLCLISGGGSALLESLAPSLTLDDLQRATSLLLASGATIQEFNTVRKHLSLIKGGQLARAVAPARMVTLVLSDVVGSPLDVIASGPTVPDKSTWVDAWAIVERYGLAARLPQSVRQRLEAGMRGELDETPKPGDPVFKGAITQIVGDNAVAAEAARAEAERLGWNAMILTTWLEGEAREVARVGVAIAREVQTHGRPVAAPACLILGGETTVTLGEDHGRGGRNQELALAAALALDGTSGITIVTLATDGSDGPTDAAGACVDGSTASRARGLGLDLAAALRSHDAYPVLDAINALIRTGPTRTNVNDLLFAFVAG